MPNFQILSTSIEREYCDEWETIISMSLRRDDGTEATVWVAAGVPDYHRGSAQAAGHRCGFESVRACDFGSWDAWCGFDQPEDGDEMQDLKSDIVDAVSEEAMRIHRGRQQEATEPEIEQEVE